MCYGLRIGMSIVALWIFISLSHIVGAHFLFFIFVYPLSFLSFACEEHCPTLLVYQTLLIIEQTFKSIKKDSLKFSETIL